MRVAHLSFSTGGGAGYGALGIHRGLLDLGVDSHFLHLHGEAPVEQLHSIERRGGLAQRLRESLYFRWNSWREGRSAAPFSAVDFPLEVRLADYVEKVDILHLHHLAYTLDLEGLLAAVPKEVPVFWTAHDMNPFTGGCHYNLDCFRYEAGCGACPQLPKGRRGDLSERNHHHKQRLLAGRPVCLVGNSEWTTGHARRSSVFEKDARFETIYYGLDAEALGSVELGGDRARWGCAEDAFVILSGSENLEDKRKGMDVLLEAFRRLRQGADGESWQLLLFGARPHGALGEVEGCTFTGYLGARADLGSAYRSADCFVMPSRQEAFGLTALEAMVCGVSAVLSRGSGVAEIIEESYPSFTYEAEDVDALVAQLRRLRALEERREKALAMARALRERFTLAVAAGRYQQLYRAFLDGKAA